MEHLVLVSKGEEAPMKQRAWRYVATVSITLAMVLALTAVAGTAPTQVSGRTVTSVKVIRETVSQEFSSPDSTEFADVPGAATTVTVLPNTQAFILIRFSAESDCFAPGTQAHCSLRIMVGDVEAEPASGTDFHFDSADGISGSARDLSESHSMDRSVGPLGSGAYTVKVQWAVINLFEGSGSGIFFTLDDWSLTVERVSPLGPVGTSG
jgi:hypothetical protein